MNTNAFETLLDQAPCMLSEGAVIERLRRAGDFELDSNIFNSAFIYDREKQAALEAIYRQYIDIGVESGLPILISTPTWRASRERIESAGMAERDVNGDNYRFFDRMRKSYGTYGEKVLICGLMSCRGDAYKPEETLSEEDAREFHEWQANKLANAGVDLLFAATLPALSEAKGLAAAMAATDVPYIVSFVVRPQGTLLDGTPLNEAISSIDSAVKPKPVAFMANCTHASFFKSALLHEQNSSTLVRERVVGLLANTAALTPEDLDNSETLVEEAPETFGHLVADLHESLGMKVLGGCCGTDERHIRALAHHLTG